MLGQAPSIRLIDVEIEPLAGALGGFLSGSLFAFWPDFAVRLYAPLLRVSPTVVESPSRPMTLMMTLQTVRTILAESV